MWHILFKKIGIDLWHLCLCSPCAIYWGYILLHFFYGKTLSHIRMRSGDLKHLVWVCWKIVIKIKQTIILLWNVHWHFSKWPLAKILYNNSIRHDCRVWGRVGGPWQWCVRENVWGVWQTLCAGGWVGNYSFILSKNGRL